MGFGAEVNPLRVTVEGRREWRWWTHTINDNNKPDGSHGTLWKNGRWIVHSRNGYGDVLRVEWSFPRKWSSDVAALLRFGSSSVQLHVALSKLGSVWLTVHVHPKLLGWFVPDHGERLFGARLFYIGYLAWVELGFDSENDSTGTAAFRLRHPPCVTCGQTDFAHARDIPGGKTQAWAWACDSYKPRALTWRDRLHEWPGLRFKVRLRVRDLLLGKKVYSQRVAKVKEVVVPLDGREYPATWSLTVSEWKRPRWPWPTVRYGSTLDVPHPPAFAGKGENSWDCGDDGFFSQSSNAKTPSEAIGSYVAGVLRQRERHGHPSNPDVFQPKAVA